MTSLSGIDLSGPHKSHLSGHVVEASDVERQTATVRALLKRLVAHPAQLLADEVGMGKTYVALAVASRLRPPGSSCRIAVLVPNRELAIKWEREIREFNTTCVTDRRLMLQPLGHEQSYAIDDLADLVSAVPRRQLAIIRYGSHGLASKQLQDSAERIAAAAWALSLDPRLSTCRSALRRAFGATSRHSVDTSLADEVKKLKHGARPLLPQAAPTGRNRWSPTHIEGHTGQGLWEKAVEAARGAATQSNSALREGVRTELLSLVRAALIAQLPPFDLVVVDEAHNWTNRANGADAARLAFLHRSRHALLLTATPLQLDADDLPNLLGQFTDLGASLRKKPPSQLAHDLGFLSARLADASIAATRFRSVWAAKGDAEVTVVGSTVVVSDDGLQSAINELTDANRALERSLRPWLIRHRRSRAHRRVLVGAELRNENLGPRMSAIPERTILHDALGIEDHNAQLAQLALMRLVGLALAQRGEGRRTTLAASMTVSAFK